MKTNVAVKQSLRIVVLEYMFNSKHAKVKEVRI